MKKIIVIGAGGVGFWTALALARHGERVVVFDDDTLDGSGAERLPDVRVFGRRFERKIELLRFLARDVDVKEKKFSSTDIDVLSRDDILLDCSDLSSEQRVEFIETAAAAGARYIRASYDLTASAFIVVVAAGLGFSRNPARGGYTIPPAIEHAMMAGGFVADVLTRIMRGEAITLPRRLEVKYEES